MSLVSTLGQWPPPPGATSELSDWARKFQKSTQARCEELARRINSEFIVGTLAQRPASSGIPRIYFATNTGTPYLDTPSGWISLLGGGGGPAGPQGLPGPPGIDGQDGVDGNPGPPGSAGATGASGSPGAAGPQGPAGPPGIDGQDGIDGDPGTPGAAGAAGVPGPTGDSQVIWPPVTAAPWEIPFNAPNIFGGAL